MHDDTATPEGTTPQGTSDTEIAATRRAVDAEKSRRARSRARHRRERTAGIVFASVLGAILILGVAGAAWIGVRGALAYGHVADAQRAAENLADSLTDPAAAAEVVPGLTADTSAARALTSDPVWGAAENLPWIGPQLAATATVIAAVDDVATTALEPLAQAASGFSLDTLRPAGGAFDVAAIASLTDVATTATDSLREASASVDAIDTTELLAPLAAPVTEVRDLLTSGLTAADALRRTSQLLPLALGADGPRNYLVMFQNNAEWRSLGGIVGAMAMIHTDAGRMDLVDQRSATNDFSRLDEPAIPKRSRASSATSPGSTSTTSRRSPTIRSTDHWPARCGSERREWPSTASSRSIPSRSPTCSRPRDPLPFQRANNSRARTPCRSS